MVNREIVDERRYAPAVRAWHPAREQRARDRTAVARYLYGQGWLNWQIAEVLAVHWAQVDHILKGEQ